MVNAQASLCKLVVTADGEGVVSHAGCRLLVGLADKVGLTDALSLAMAPTRERVSAHDPGVVLRDLAVMLADGGRCLADLKGQRQRAARLGAAVASDSTAYRVIDSIDGAGLERLRDAVAAARAQAWQLGARAPVEFPRFSGHLTAELDWLAGKDVCDAQDPVVLAGVPARSGAAAQEQRPHDPPAGQGAGLLAAVAA